MMSPLLIRAFKRASSCSVTPVAETSKFAAGDVERLLCPVVGRAGMAEDRCPIALCVEGSMHGVAESSLLAGLR